MNTNETGKSLINFLNSCPCNFLAVKTISTILDNNGFKRIDLKNGFNIDGIKNFYIVKNDSAIFAFSLNNNNLAKSGFRIITAHSDSPGFRIKPNPETITEGGILKLNTEVYGGPILYTWFDRPLSIAGRVLIKGENPLNPQTKLINIPRPIMVIPHLPIHFNRQVNEGNPLSRQKDMMPIVGIVNNEAEKGNALINFISKELGVSTTEILDFDLLLHPTQTAEIVGLNNEFICSGRIDDLSMVHAGLSALIENKGNKNNQVLAIFDNEETGSGTKQGAASPVLAKILRLICKDNVEFYQSIENSFMVSADNGHAFHPNYPEKFDPTNHPVMGGGPIIKINANCKYMTDAKSSAIFASICNDANVPCQYFVNHSDIAGGSTLGNILTSQIDIEGVDVGNPIWAMHSACETGAVIDQYYMIKAFKRFYEC